MEYNLRSLVEGGLAIGLGIVLNMIIIFRMPQGGSVTAASMAPIIIYAMRWGVGRGGLVGVLYGIVDFMMAPSFFSPMQFVLDYLLAYGCLGLAGISQGKELTGTSVSISTILAISARGLCHVLSGVIFFSEYAGSQNPWIYSISYNLSYLLPEMLITVVVILLLYKPLLNFIDRSR